MSAGSSKKPPVASSAEDFLKAAVPAEKKHSSRAYSRNGTSSHLAGGVDMAKHR